MRVIAENVRTDRITPFISTTNWYPRLNNLITMQASKDMTSLVRTYDTNSLQDWKYAWFEAKRNP